MSRKTFEVQVPEGFTEVADVAQLWLPMSDDADKSITGVFSRTEVTAYDPDAGDQITAIRPIVTTADGGVWVLPTHYLLIQKLVEVQDGARVFIACKGESSRVANGKNLIDYAVAVRP